MTRVIIDGDACPVTESVIDLTAGTSIFVVLVRSYAHFSIKNYPKHVKVVYVDDGPDHVDFKIVQLATKNDIVITQDYGLASLLIDKVRIVMHHNGMIYHHQNMPRLLEQRYQHAQARKQGTRHKGPKKFTDDARAEFIQKFKQVIKEISS